MTSEQKPLHYLAWNLRALMDQRGIRRIADLHRRLRDVGVHKSSTQLSRIVAQRPKELSTDLLDALVTILDCDISDLLVLEKAAPHQEPEPAKGGTAPAKKRPPVF